MRARCGCDPPGTPALVVPRPPLAPAARVHFPVPPLRQLSGERTHSAALGHVRLPRDKKKRLMYPSRGMLAVA